MQKKNYEAPKINRVKLEIKNSILSVCHSSPNMTPNGFDGDTCAISQTCFNPAGGYP
jgi:hypothetical protein